MSAQPAPTPAPSARDYTGLLEDIIQVGAKLIHDLGDNPAKPGQSRASDYHLITRSLRRSILLVDKLAETPDQARAQQNAARRTAARKRIIREVQDAIQHRARGPNADNLEAEFLERLDSPDLDDDIDARPIPEIIADICRDLRLGPAFEASRWKRRTPEDVQSLCALAAKSPIEPPEADVPRPPRPAPPVLASLPDLSDDPADAVTAIFRHEALTRDQR